MTEEYQYKVEEKSLTQKFLLRFLWIPIVEHIPPHITPNSITIFGAFFMFLSAFFIWLAIQKFYWGFLVASLCVFIYMTADNIDGHHARRTHQSSKLGEFLDHWLDSLNAVVVNLCVAFSIHLKGEMLLLFMVSIALAFFATIWEHHHTGVFYSGRLGTNEGLFLIIALYILLFFVRDASWIHYSKGTLNLASVLVYFSICICGMTTLGALVRVHSHYWEFLPILVCLISICFLSFQGILSEFWCAFALLTSNVLFCGSFLLSRLANQKFPYRKWIILGLSCLAIGIWIFSPKFFKMIHFYFFIAIAILAALTIFGDLILAISCLRKKS